MNLTKKQAIDFSIKLWEFLAGTGKEKEDWGEWDKYSEFASEGGAIDLGCFLCEYDLQQSSDEAICGFCPYNHKFGNCEERLSPFSKWVNARFERTRKKYAKIFLEQLYQLREEK